jgi:hypothetical protein
MAERMELVARAGHPCGEDFQAKNFLRQHPEYAWMAPFLRDMKAGPWTQFKSSDHENSSSAGNSKAKGKSAAKSSLR